MPQHTIFNLLNPNVKLFGLEPGCHNECLKHFRVQINLRKRDSPNES